jgi:hypothetical protein
MLDVFKILGYILTIGACIFLFGECCSCMTEQGKIRQANITSCYNFKGCPVGLVPKWLEPHKSEDYCACLPPIPSGYE